MVKKIVEGYIPERDRITQMYDEAWKIEKKLIGKNCSKYNLHLARYVKMVGKLSKRYLKKAEFFIDYGTGDGKIVDQLIKQFGQSVRIVGLDISGVAVDFCNKKWKDFPNISAQLIKKTIIPFEKGTIDLITCAEVFEHLYDPENLLLEAKRVLKKNSIIILTTPNRYSESFFGIPRLLPKKLKRNLRKRHDRWQSKDEKEAKLQLQEVEKKFSEIKSHVKIYTPGELKKITMKFGFKTIHQTGASLNIPLPSLYNKFFLYRSGMQLIEWIIRKIPFFNSRLLKQTIIILEKE